MSFIAGKHSLPKMRTGNCHKRWRTGRGESGKYRYEAKVCHADGWSGKGFVVHFQCYPQGDEMEVRRRRLEEDVSE
jgi:hypothetical protein